MIITACEVWNFKNYTYKKVNLGPFSLIVGQNNSGKSTILHAVLLAHEIIKKALNKNLNAKDKITDLKSTTFTFDDLKIIPLSTVDSIWKDNKFTQTNETRIKLFFEENSIECVLKRGKNGNVAVGFNKSEDFPMDKLEELASMESPHALLVPGLAGILSKENYVGRYARTKSITVGDANLVLRNIVTSLGLNPEKEKEFDFLKEKIQFIFPSISDLRVSYNENTDEFLTVEIEKDNEGVYFDIVTAGTGFLQTLQILSYIFEYKPKVLLLDEPDSHLHADNQVKLLNTLKELCEEYKFQVIISSHSREFLQNTTPHSVVWLNSDSEIKISTTDSTMVQAYIDLGGLDKLDILRLNPKSKSLLTEDENLTFWKSILREKFGDNYETRVIVNTFKGKSNKVSLFLASDFYKKHFPNSKTAFVIDRDFDSEDTLNKYCEDAKKYNLKPFVIRCHEIENLLIRPDVIGKALELLECLIDKEEVIDIIKQAVDQTENLHFDKLVDKLSMDNNKWTPSACNKEGARIIEEKKKEFDEYLSWLRGKPVLKKIREIITTTYKKTLTDNLLAKAVLEVEVYDVEEILKWIENN